MKQTLSIALCLFCKIFFGQDTSFYATNGDKTSSLKLAYRYKVLKKDPANNTASEKTYLGSTGKIIMESNYSDFKMGRLGGKSTDWYENGKVQRETEYKDGEMDGHRISYYESGKIKRNDVFTGGKFVDGKCFAFEGKDTTYYPFEMMPEFKGGASAMMNYIGKEVKYPKKAYDHGVQGKVFVKFIVEKDGTISNIEIAKGVSTEIDAEAKRVIGSMPRWRPGYQDGIPVRVYYNVPISFKLN